MKTIIDDIRHALKATVDEKTQATAQHFFKEAIKHYGVKIPVVHTISKDYFKQVEGLPKNKIFALCDELWQSGYLEESFVACDWSYYIRKRYAPADFKVFERWVNEYVNNWASCDTLCNHSVGEFIERYPSYVGELKRWAVSGNRWVRRAAAVSFIIPARKGLFIEDILEIAGILLLDTDDLVQKGYGWMLKAASMSENFVKGHNDVKSEHLDAVFNFIVTHKAVMPRTALRYAIEKMPPALRAQAMQK